MVWALGTVIGTGPPPGLVMVQVKEAEPEAPKLSVALRATGKAPEPVGVPDTVPVPGSRAKPAGRPVADHEMMVAETDKSVAVAVSGVIVVPNKLVWSPGSVTETVPPPLEPAMVQVNEAEPEAPKLSVALRATGKAPELVGVPDTVPVPGSRAKPAGRPVTDHEVIVAPTDKSVAVAVSGVIVVPDKLVWSPGLVTTTVLVTVQVKLAEPEPPTPSVAVMVTG